MSKAIDRPGMTTAATPRARVSFDGRTVTVHRRLAPGLPWRPPTSHAISRVLGAKLVWLGGEGERRQFDLCLASEPTVQIGVHIGQNPHKEPAQRREQHWRTLVGAINGGSGQWMRGVLGATVGMGPWSEEVWRQAETLAPELCVFGEWDTHVPSLRGRTARSHREMIESTVLSCLRGGADVRGTTVRRGSWNGFDADRSPLNRARAEAWLDLIVTLRDQHGFDPADDAPAE